MRMLRDTIVAELLAIVHSIALELKAIITVVATGETQSRVNACCKVVAARVRCTVAVSAVASPVRWKPSRRPLGPTAGTHHRVARRDPPQAIHDH